jgi:hypothetical protein
MFEVRLRVASAFCPEGASGQKRPYDRLENRRVDDRFQSTAANGRRVLERIHSPKQSMAIFPAYQRRSSMPNALNLLSSRLK